MANVLLVMKHALNYESVVSVLQDFDTPLPLYDMNFFINEN